MIMIMIMIMIMMIIIMIGEISYLNNEDSINFTL